MDNDLKNSKDMAADMNIVADFLQENGRFVGDMVHVPIKHLAKRIKAAQIVQSDKVFYKGVQCGADIMLATEEAKSAQGTQVDDRGLREAIFVVEHILADDDDLNPCVGRRHLKTLISRARPRKVFKLEELEDLVHKRFCEDRISDGKQPIATIVILALIEAGLVEVKP